MILLTYTREEEEIFLFGVRGREGGETRLGGVGTMTSPPLFARK
jgi:hypothetical protein